ncbi:MAG: 3-phosphoshikimate 1-carboxyvinyltransferase [Myxococcales bacterium]|nr:3-phosphoshikimate 1-carboxyvinyltransferase [Myxococcales bacterium]
MTATDTDASKARVRCPGSKSMTQRALIIAALGNRPARIEGALWCDDSRYLSELLRRLGVGVVWSGERVDVQPSSRLQADGDAIFCGNAGTTVRFASCLALVCGGVLHIDGDARMRQRPIAPLIHALESLGVHARFHGEPLHVPFVLQGIEGQATAAGCSVDRTSSSQFASGLLMVAPRLRDGLCLELRGAQVSQPYLQMTIEMMIRAGARVEASTDGREIRVGGNTRYSADVYRVEPDWSGAALLQAAACAAGTEIDIEGLVSPDRSLQGDAQFALMLRELRAPRPHDFDLSDAPDLIAPLVVAALFSRHPSRIFNVSHARVKESDRIFVLCQQLSRLGLEIEEREDGMIVHPLRADAAALSRADPVALDPHGDHRMAMAFGALSLRIPIISVMDPSCVSKSFPSFWDELERLRPFAKALSLAAADAPRAATVVLVGMRGSGKSTVARLVARRLKLRCVDADEELASLHGFDHAGELLAERGEPEFRRLESELLAELMAQEGIVLATGGGAVLDAGTRGALRAHATVWLDAPLEALAARIGRDERLRPRLTDADTLADELAELQARRAALYAEVAWLKIDTAERSPDQVADEIADALTARTSSRL